MPNADHPLLAAAQVAGSSCEAHLEAREQRQHPGEPLGDDRLQLVAGTEAEVLPHGQLGEHRPRRQHHRHPRPSDGPTVPGGLLAVDEHLAPVGRVQAEDRPQRAGLPAPVVTDERHHLPRADPQVDVEHRHAPPVAHVERSDRQPIGGAAGTTVVAGLGPRRQHLEVEHLELRPDRAGHSAISGVAQSSTQARTGGARWWRWSSGASRIMVALTGTVVRPGSTATESAPNRRASSPP